MAFVGLLYFQISRKLIKILGLFQLDDLLQVPKFSRWDDKRKASVKIFEEVVCEALKGVRKLVLLSYELTPA